jgi:hypothetical protein
MSDDIYLAEIDEEQIRQVVHIILRNAKEAMPHGGTITISFENVRISRKDYLPVKDGNYVKISFQDEGTGIKREHLNRIFDPYFTTKDLAARRGLALDWQLPILSSRNTVDTLRLNQVLVAEQSFIIICRPSVMKQSLTKRLWEHQVKCPKKGKNSGNGHAKSVRMLRAMLTFIGYDVEFARRAGKQ